MYLFNPLNACFTTIKYMMFRLHNFKKSILVYDVCVHIYMYGVCVHACMHMLSCLPIAKYVTQDNLGRWSSTPVFHFVWGRALFAPISMRLAGLWASREFSYPHLSSYLRNTGITKLAWVLEIGVQSRTCVQALYLLLIHHHTVFRNTGQNIF